MHLDKYDILRIARANVRFKYVFDHRRWNKSLNELGKLARILVLIAELNIYVFHLELGLEQTALYPRD